MTTRPSGSAATALTPPRGGPARPGRRGCTGSHTSTRPPSPAGDHPPVRQHRHRRHRALVAAEFGRAGAGSAGSHTSTRPSRAAGDYPPVRQRRHRPHPALVAAELGRAGARLRRVPHQHPAVVPRR